MSRLDGKVLRFDRSSKTVKTVLDLKSMLDFSSVENGLVSIAIPPGEPDRLIAVYSVPSDVTAFTSRLASFTSRADGTYDATSEQVILDVPQRAGTHSMNHAAFGPDGYLYISIGDDLDNFHTGRSVDAAQRLDSLKGKMLRIDVTGTEGQRYLVPADNPFVGVQGAAPEVYALGLRNPWRFTIEPDGAIYLGDVGQDSREELNRIEPGANYGWPYLEGTLCHAPDRCDGLFEAPRSEYGYGGPKAIVGAPVYTGDEIPALRGRIIFADYIAGHLWSYDPATGETSQELEGSSPITSLVRGSDRSIYALRYDGMKRGQILRIAPAAQQDSGADAFPKLLSQTGCVDAADVGAMAAGVVPYKPTAELWSDGAEKSRYLAIPDDRRIGVHGSGRLAFPDGSVLIKHFGYGGKLHETRLMMRYEGVWRGYSYRWREDGSDAELLDNALTTTLPGGQRWTYPSRSQCDVCHNEASDHVLGLEVAGLRAPHPDVPERGDQLLWLRENEYLLPELTDAQLLLPAAALHAAPGDEAAGLEARTRSYLHANCAMCHQPGASGRGELDLRYQTPLARMKGCEAQPIARVWGHGTWDEQRIIKPGDPMLSTMYLRVTALSLFRMPPLASDQLDAQGVGLIRDWITSLESCD